MRMPFDKKELKPQGIYKTYGSFGGAPYADVEILDTPITPRDNCIAFFTGGDYQWIPDWSSDYFDFSADCNPDVTAFGAEGGVDNFGVQWEAMENGLPAMVRPGNPKLKSIHEWRNLTWPDVSQWDWAGCRAHYDGIVDAGRMVRPYIQCGLFERMISLLDFAGALYALAEDPEECRSFLERMADFNIALIDQYYRWFPIDAICFLDDWSSQRAPLFSVNMAREILFPAFSRIVNHVKSLGLIFTWHSCGNGLPFVPLMLEAGVDAWQLQTNAVDMVEALRLADGRLVMESSVVYPIGTPEEEIAASIRTFMEKYGKGRKATVCFCDEYYCTPAFMRNTAYEAGRKLLYSQT